MSTMLKTFVELNTTFCNQHDRRLRNVNYLRIGTRMLGILPNSRRRKNWNMKKEKPSASPTQIKSISYSSTITTLMVL